MAKSFTKNLQFQSTTSLSVKIAIIGEGAVGKTSIRRSYLGDQFRSEYLLTIGADFALKTIQINKNHKLKLQIWDLAGQPRFNSVRKGYYRGCSAGILVFDRTRPETLKLAFKWLLELWTGSGKGPIPVLILGNKSDLLKEQTITSTDTRVQQIIAAFNKETLSKKGFTLYYVKTSAKSGLNIDHAFTLLAHEILQSNNYQG